MTETPRYEIQYKSGGVWRPHPGTWDCRDEEHALKTWREICLNERSQLDRWRLVSVGVTVIRRGVKR